MELKFFAWYVPFTDPDIIIRERDSLVSGFHSSRSIIADGNGNGKSNKVKYTEHLGPLGAQFEIDFSNPIEISVNRTISRSTHVLYVNLVEPILRFLLISKGYILLHSACLGLNGHGILLSAPPDTGKTTAVLKCMKRGFWFLSDDMTIIQLPSDAICFPKPMTISAHTYETAVNGSKNGHNTLGMKLRSLVHSKGGRQFMRKLGNHNLPIFTINAVGQTIIRPPKFKVEDILNTVNIQERTTVQTLCFLQTGGEETVNIPMELALEKAIENSDDAFLFPPYREMLHYIQINGKSAKDLLEEERRMLKGFFSHIDCLELKSDSRSWYERVNTLAQNGRA